MGQLFFVHGGLEVPEHLGNRIQRVPSFQLGLHLDHHLHDVPVPHHVDSMFVKQIDVECRDANQSDEKQCGNLHFLIIFMTEIILLLLCL